MNRELFIFDYYQELIAMKKQGLAKYAGYVCLMAAVVLLGATALFFTGCPTSESPGADITWTVTANGAANTTTSTAITITFSGAVSGLTAADITVTNGTGGVTKGTLTNTDDTHWSLGITVTAEGNVKVKIEKAGIETTEKTVAVYKAETPAALTWTAQADGEAGTTTSTAINLTFSGAVTELTAADIAVADDGGSVTKGTLTNTDDTHWALAITVAAEGNVKVSISKAGIETTEKTVAVYKAGAPPLITWTAQADGEAGATTSTAINLTFSGAVTELTADDITVADDGGSVTTGSLTNTDDTHWALGITVAAEGNVKVSISKAGIETTEKDVAVYKAETPPFPGTTGFPISSVGGASGHVLLLKSDGTVWATGNNQYGQFGNGTTIADSPYTTSTYTQVADHTVSVGEIGSRGDSFIIKDDGSLWAAGRNNTGTHTSATSTFEKEIDSGVKAFSLHDGIYVLKDDGSLWVRGTNDTGQLGTGTMTDVTEWTKVIDSGVVSIKKSQYFGLVLKDDGTVWGAGSDTTGALGQGGGTPPQKITQFTKIFEDAKAIAVGSSNHSVILKNDGTVWAAGSAQDGKLGDGRTGNTTASNVTSFQQINEIGSDVTAIAAGSVHTLILKSDGSVWGTGRRNNGQLGDTPTSAGSTTTNFIKIVDSGVRQISAKVTQSFIIKDDGTLWVTGGVSAGTVGNTAAQGVEFTQITLFE
jgi:alpha-tubulin suppressor-like RCC1 family protein/methionine-rich copper-binding protein CopC